MNEPVDPIEIPGPVCRRFEGKTALVAGGGHTPPKIGTGFGIGAATSILLGREGCRVAVLDIDGDAAERSVAAIKGAGGEGIAIRADVSIEADCRRAFDEVGKEFGELHALLNTVGITRSRRGVTEFLAEEWEEVLAVNVRAFVLTAKYAIPLMTRGGSIVNVSSADAVVPGHGNVSYAASKGAVNSVTRHIAVREGFRGIRANAIMPGAAWTPSSWRNLGTKVGEDMKPLGTDELTIARERRRRVTAIQTEGSAWDIAHAGAFLASDQSRWITGQVIMVDGGASVIAPWDTHNKPERVLPDYSIQIDG
jgi:NAD(P)-dependent dehydrogenase (short-subunit alcohol dehydrogenase family)